MGVQRSRRDFKQTHQVTAFLSACGFRSDRRQHTQAQTLADDVATVRMRGPQVSPFLVQGDLTLHHDRLFYVESGLGFSLD